MGIRTVTGGGGGGGENTVKSYTSVFEIRGHCQKEKNFPEEEIYRLFYKVQSNRRST